MNEDALRVLLTQVQSGAVEIEAALKRLRLLPMEQLACARLDHHRSLRTGLPEAVFGEHKSVQELIEILGAMLQQPNVALATRISAEKAQQVLHALPQLSYHPKARSLTGNEALRPQHPDSGAICIVSAGTSDLPVAEEARVCLHCLGHVSSTIHDVGVAGIHRLLQHVELLQQSRVVIAVAGMEGALPSVVAGLTAAPVIAVPTSIGYGAGSGGYAALFAMLNSCAPGLAVVNIDNGFGAACMAAAIMRKR